MGVGSSGVELVGVDNRIDSGDAELVDCTQKIGKSNENEQLGGL